MRLFVGIAIPEPVRQALKEILQDLAGKISQDTTEISWVKAENWHVTLKFLGECSDDRPPSITQALKNMAGPERSFSLQLGGLYSFGEKGPLRTVWIGLDEGKEPLAALAASVEAACERLGFKKENRPFTPHVTLAKVKFSKDPQAIRSLLQENPIPTLSPFTVDSLILFRSILSPSGPTYTALQTIPLGKR